MLRMARTEGRFTSAYNAAHAASLAALPWHGYRSENRFMVLQCLSRRGGDLPRELPKMIHAAGLRLTETQTFSIAETRYDPDSFSVGIIG